MQPLAKCGARASNIYGLTDKTYPGYSQNPLAITKQEVAEVIDGFAQAFPERVTGNEAHPIIARRIANLVAAERPAVVELLRDWIGVRIPESKRRPGDGVHGAAMWLALEIFQR